MAQRESHVYDREELEELVSDANAVRQRLLRTVRGDQADRVLMAITMLLVDVAADSGTTMEELIRVVVEMSRVIDRGRVN